MRERPILFNGAMVRAILSGAKTQTRRPVKGIPWRDGVNPNFSQARAFSNADEFRIAGSEEMTTGFRCPFGQPGERLWVRETWTDLTATHGRPWERYNSSTGLYERGIHPFLWYRADGDQPDIGGGDPPNLERWRPAAVMPRSACRLVLEITDVRVERLQAISEADVLAEGIIKYDMGSGPAMYGAGNPDSDPIAALSPRAAFEKLWQSTGGDWDANPWGWVISFQRLP